jgi:hypothetical protein
MRNVRGSRSCSESDYHGVLGRNTSFRGICCPPNSSDDKRNKFLRKFVLSRDVYGVTLEGFGLVIGFIPFFHPIRDITLQITVTYTHVHSSVFIHGIHHSSGNGFQRQTFLLLWPAELFSCIYHSNFRLTHHPAPNNVSLNPTAVMFTISRHGSPNIPYIPACMPGLAKPAVILLI